MNERRKGFTLIEMLVVIGIIAALSSALIFSYGRVVKAAARAKAVEIVSNARTALEEMYRNNDGWPQGIYKAAKQNGYYVMDAEIAKLFAKNRLMNVDCKTTDNNGKELDIKDYKLRGKDRCGIVDPWAQALIETLDKDISGDSILDKPPVPSGGTIRDHRLYFAVDQDDDGFVDKAEGAPGMPVRSKAIVWCAGADGGLSDCSTAATRTEKLNGRTVTNRDNIYSWERAQEDRK